MIRSLVSVGLVLFFLSGCRSSQPTPMRNTLEMEFIRIPGGEFEMGDTFEGKNEDALPTRVVHISTFYLSRYETSFAQFDAFARREHYPVPMQEVTIRGSRAVGEISWSDARAFCSSVDARLPTEEEWEYAASGGKEKRLYADADTDEEAAARYLFLATANGESGPVDFGQPNRFGLYNMSGNVAEWIGGYYEKYTETGVDPIWNDNASRQVRIIRGGGMSSDLILLRTYWRAGTLASVRTPSIGVRCARDAT
jgi:formylglycine-generating enzyme required for sulfatase activity